AQHHATITNAGVADMLCTERQQKRHEPSGDARKNGSFHVAAVGEGRDTEYEECRAESNRVSQPMSQERSHDYKGEHRRERDDAAADPRSFIRSSCPPLDSRKLSRFHRSS